MTASRTTIHEVARRAGVSVGTVSRALNGRPGVSAATRAAVTDAATALGYRPAAAARAVRLGRSGLVGAFLAHCREDDANLQPVGRLVTAGLSGALQEAGLALLSFEDIGDAGAVVAEHQLDAAVLVAIGDNGLPAETDLRCPVVGVDSACGIEVRTDHAAGIALAVAHLAALGHRRVGYAGAQPMTVAGRERRAGFEAAAARHGLDPDPRLRREGDFSAASGRAAAHALLALDAPPTAIVAVCDDSAAGVLAAAGAAACAVPGHLSVTGFDDLPVARMVTPALTTVRQDAPALGRLAAATVLQAIAEDRPGPVLVAPELVVRASTGPVGRT